MCSACSDGEYQATIEADARARQQGEGRYDRYPAVAPHLHRAMELRQELQQEPAEEHGDDGTRKHDMPNGEEWTVYQCLCGARFVEPTELREHIAEETEHKLW